MPSPKRKRSRSREREEYKYPPRTQTEFRAVVLQYLANEKVSLPLFSLSLLKNLRTQYKHSLGKMIDFDLNQVLQELSQKQALKLQPLQVASKQCFSLVSISRESIASIHKEASRDKPRKYPKEIPNLKLAPWSKELPQEELKVPLPQPLELSGGEYLKENPWHYSFQSLDPGLVVLDLSRKELPCEIQSEEDLDTLPAQEWQSSGFLVARCAYRQPEAIEKCLENWGYTVMKFNWIRKESVGLEIEVRNKETLVVGSKSKELIEVPDKFGDESQMYEFLVRNFQAEKRVEVFGRKHRTGWIVLDESV